MDYDYLKQQFAAHPSNLLMLLHEIQKANPQHYISREDMRWSARYLNIPLSTVYGVVHYYSMFSDVPRGRHIIRICRSPVCRMLGTGTVAASLEALLGAPVGAVTDDGHFSIETSECLGHCERAPVMMVDEVVHGPLTHAKINALIDALRPPPWK